jgi:hypothetical protein
LLTVGDLIPSRSTSSAWVIPSSLHNAERRRSCPGCSPFAVSAGEIDARVAFTAWSSA